VCGPSGTAAGCRARGCGAAPILAPFRALLGFDMFLPLQELYTMLLHRPLFCFSFKSSLKKPILTATRYSQVDPSGVSTPALPHGTNCCHATEVAEEVGTAQSRQRGQP